MAVRVEEIKKELNLKSFGQKGWQSNKKLECPSCNRDCKFGIKFTEKSGVVHCFICDYTTSIYNYLKDIDRKDLISHEAEYSINSKMVSIKQALNPEKEEEKELVEVQLPYGAKMLKNDPYLDSRGFLPEHYENLKPCYTESFLERRLKNYVIFQIYQEGKRVSWLARSKNSYKWHDENLKKAKEGLEELQLRYRNSDGTDFGKILGGYDEITPNTKKVYLVEGLFDKVGVDSKLDLFKSEEIRCCFTFGNKVSDEQIDLLKKTNVKYVGLIYDYGTIQQSKTYSLKLSRFFDVGVGVPDSPDYDPGDMSIEQLCGLIENLQNPMEFYTNNLNKAL